MLLHVCPNPRNGPGVNPDVNHGLQEMTIYPIVTNVPSGGNADREGGCACVEAGGGGVGFTQLCVPYPQFCCEYKTALNETKGALKTKKKIII